MDMNEIFEVLSLKLENYEKRQSQIELSKDIYKLMIDGKIGLLEAPTGIGKSFAYLIAASLFVKSFEKKVVIATSTINLQKQLILKDIPVIKKIFSDIKFDIALGRQNYACKRKFYTYAFSIFSNIGDPKEFLSNIQNGTKDEFEILDDNVFEQIRSDKDSCMGRFCPQFKNCFFFNARMRLKDADIIITNHHLVFSDLFDVAEIFDSIDVLIFDEAHNIESNLTSFATMTFNFYDQANVIKNFFGIASKMKLFELINKVAKILDDQKLELANLANTVEYSVNYGDEFTAQKLMRISYLQEQLTYEFINYKDKVDIELGVDFKAIIDKLSLNLKILNLFMKKQGDEYVYWIEKFKDIVLFNITDLNFADLLKNKLYPKVSSVIFTSATLSVNGNFNLIKNTLGISEPFEKVFKTEFDYKSQAKLVVLKGISNPNTKEYIDDLANVIVSVAKQLNKGILVLFTSYKVLNDVYTQTKDELSLANYRILKQGMLDNYNMQKYFFKDKTILFGVNSFWEGIDVSGDYLSCVIITKLPFEVPTHPIEKAKYDTLAKNGQNAFLNYSLQKAILKFKQGFGRLIRTKNDTGIIIIADNRVLTKPYGKAFIHSLPDVSMEIKSVDNLSLDPNY